jgi:hypothetical protein
MNVMRKIYLLSLILLGLFLFVSKAEAQIPAIDSLKIIPHDPTTNDSVKVICYATFPSGPCNLIYHNINIQSHGIGLLLQYDVGAATYICSGIDTITLGKLNSGNYEMIAALNIIPLSSISDYDTVYFSVKDASSLITYNADTQIELFPNPATDALTLKTLLKNGEIQILNSQGKIVLKEKLSGEFSQTLDLTTLDTGLYIIKIYDKQTLTYVQKLIKLHK